MEKLSPALVNKSSNIRSTSDHGTLDMGATPAQFPRGGRKRKRILLIEPDEANAQLILALLADDGSYDVARAADPVEAFSTIHPTTMGVGSTDQGADLVMLDLAPLDSEHRKALHTFFEGHKKWPPMIILSGWPIQYVENVLIGINKPGVVAKPFDVDTLLCTVHKILKTKGE